MPRTRDEIEGAIWREDDDWTIRTRMQRDHEDLILEVLLDIRDALAPEVPTGTAPKGE